MVKKIMASGIVLVFIMTIVYSGCLEDTIETELNFSYEECTTLTEYDNETGLYTVNWEDEINRTIWIDNSSLNILAYVTINCADSLIEGSYRIINETLLLYYTIQSSPFNAKCMCTHILYYNFTNLEKRDYQFRLVEIINGENNTNLENNSLKESCINATIRGIELEIQRYLQWLEIPNEERTNVSTTREEHEALLNNLYLELEKFMNIQLQDYEITKNKTVIGWVNENCTEDSSLHIENMSKSGPFYHITGIIENDYSNIKPETKYNMTIYLVYPRSYPFPSYYIYIDKFNQIE
ncbi:MAG: hypothetical protein DRN27_07530 [Thermoplasmata archaeon]|nr:MAG: hypothetical protein DRN27_07530 [Thermoplasmata archaeon]